MSKSMLIFFKQMAYWVGYIMYWINAYYHREVAYIHSKNKTLLAVGQQRKMLTFKRRQAPREDCFTDERHGDSVLESSDSGPFARTLLAGGVAYLGQKVLACNTDNTLYILL